ncbi:tail lysozyme [Geobacter sp. OR-1]|uniref:GPW/gp25 family protein n=1 Tax=Geobacter sp. OR-1 TaxID=1266765 RepID=UPI0005435E66|nr:GPW/gp25 family protein [Geobacter sp. OR-1]GAM10174.1 tail lysozyme [Geobacter sp. OR-1]
MGSKFLGTGWKFPVTPDTNNEIALAAEEDSIADSIRIILATSPGERVMRPDFGCGIHDFLFAPNNVRTAGLIRFHVEESLRRWEPRIDLEEVAAGPAPDDPAVILLSITYRVKATDSRFNMVYPFYLERGTAL